MSVTTVFESTTADLVSFLKQPHDQPELQPVSFKGKRVLSLLLIDLLVTTALMPLLHIVSQTEWIDLDTHALNDLLKRPWFVMMLLGVVAAPFIEELIFRLCLRFEQSFFGTTDRSSFCYCRNKTFALHSTVASPPVERVLFCYFLPISGMLCPSASAEL